MCNLWYADGGYVILVPNELKVATSLKRVGYFGWRTNLVINCAKCAIVIADNAGKLLIFMTVFDIEENGKNSNNTSNNGTAKSKIKWQIGMAESVLGRLIRIRKDHSIKIKQWEND